MRIFSAGLCLLPYSQSLGFSGDCFGLNCSDFRSQQGTGLPVSTSWDPEADGNNIDGIVSVNRFRRRRICAGRQDSSTSGHTPRPPSDSWRPYWAQHHHCFHYPGGLTPYSAAAAESVVRRRDHSAAQQRCRSADRDSLPTPHHCVDAVSRSYGFTPTGFTPMQLSDQPYGNRHRKNHR
jgi:hypothetical protein